MSCGCDPELVFELADGGLEPWRRREVRAHLTECPECRELYERERELGEFLSSSELSGARSRSVRQGVAMDLPTRPVELRMLWTFLSLNLLLAALVALLLYGLSPAALIVDGAVALRGYVLELSEVFRIALAAAGTLPLVALAAGMVVDLLLVALVLSALRRWSARRPARRA